MMSVVQANSSIIFVMPDMPLVSIVTCSYNNARFIIDTLESIKRQTYPNIELVIVDDCSTDNSVDLVNEWLKTYKGEYKFICLDKNMGGSFTANLGLNTASGKYYSTIDTDDTMLPEKTAIQVNLLEQTGPNVAAVYSDCYVMDVNNQPIDGLFIQRHRKLPVYPSGNIYEILLQGNFIPGLSMLIKKTVFDDVGIYDESLVYGDYDMWLRIARKYEIIFFDSISAKYRIRPGSLSFTIRNWVYSDARIFLKHIDARLFIPRLNRLALEAYCTNDKDTMPLVNELAEKTNGAYLKAAFLLWRLRISHEYGEKVLAKLEEKIKVGSLPETCQNAGSGFANFVEIVCNLLPLNVLKGAAEEAYSNLADDRLLITRELADKLRSKYFNIAFLLCYFRIPTEYGKLILEKGNKHVDSAQMPEIKEIDQACIATFAEHIWATLTMVHLKSFAADIYALNVPHVMDLIKELARKTNNRYFRTAYLLCEFGVSPEFGNKILENKKENIGVGFSADMKKGDHSDIMSFAGQVCKTLPPGSLKEIALNAYYENYTGAIEFIEALWKTSQNKYIKTIFMLWRARVAVPDGKRILALVEEKNGSGKGSLLSDLSIYKNILFARKAL
jgi:glycosyltransferase involved in cell wall biosynthesis